MRRLFAIATLVSALAATPLWSQMRGGRMGAPIGRFGFPSHGSTFFGGGFGFGHHPGFFFNRNPFFFGHRHGFFFSGGFGYPFYPAYYGGYSYPIVVQTPAPDYSPAPRYYYESSPRPSNYYPDPYYEQGELRRDVDELTGKVDRLQRDVESGQHSKSENISRPKTVLVFKDNHTREVQNYAIVDHTLWLLDAQRAEKLPLNSLDVDATIKLNDERGIEFQMPR
jgi:hypothetical protein